MFAIVPDDAPGAAAGKQPKQASGTAAGGGARSSGVKVELDIEDAPFLDEPEEAPKPAPAKKPESAAGSSSVAGAKKADGKSGFLKRLLADKKRLAIIGGGLLGVLVAAAAAMFFLGSAPPPPPAAPEPQRIVVTGEAPRPPGAPTFQYMLKWDPFLIERRGAEGEIRFLRCGFTVPTDNQALYMEMRAKKITLRDAVFYYLTNKPLTFLSDSRRAGDLKTDLISVINEHVSAEKVKELYIEDYLIDP